MELIIEEKNLQLIEDDNPENWEDEPVNCICEEEYRMVEIGFMIGCDKCRVWYHSDCINGVSQESMPDLWICPRCTGDYLSPGQIPSPSLLSSQDDSMDIINIDNGLQNPNKVSPPNQKTQAKQPKNRSNNEGNIWFHQATKQTSLKNFPMKSFNVELSVKELEKENKQNQQNKKGNERVLSSHQFKIDNFTLDDLDLTTLEGKIEYSRRMRLAVTNPEMLDEKGNLNQEYFRPQKKVKKLEKWGDLQKFSLLQGIQKYGIGNWKEIKDSFPNELGRLELNDLRVKTCHLVGRQNLADYKGWKPSVSELKNEKNANEKLGKELGCWKSGVLVADDEGKVVKRIMESGGRLYKGE